MQMKWTTAQIGAREHYAVPRVLQEMGKLSTFYTDVWRRSCGGLGSLLPGVRGRWHHDLQEASVVSFTADYLRRRVLYPKRSRATLAESYTDYVLTGQWFAKRVCDDLATSAARPEIFFAYDTGALEAARWVKDHDGTVVLGQMDPGEEEFQIVRDEEARWSGWALAPLVVPEAYNERRRQEWDLADRIIVNSTWSMEALIRQGVPRSKLRVVPLAYEGGGRVRPARPARDDLHVLFLGQVILRKGIQYLMAAAEQLVDDPVQIDVVGPIGITDEVVRRAPANMRFVGAVPRSQVHACYEKADVFVLPTLSDGFAITQLEAMSHGLPVIVTPCCGEVVKDGVNGRIVPARDVDALAKVIRDGLEDRAMLEAQAASAILTASQFSLDQLGKSLAEVEQEATEGTRTC